MAKFFFISAQVAGVLALALLVLMGLLPLFEGSPNPVTISLAAFSFVVASIAVVSIAMKRLRSRPWIIPVVAALAFPAELVMWSWWASPDLGWLSFDWLFARFSRLRDLSPLWEPQFPLLAVGLACLVLAGASLQLGKFSSRIDGLEGELYWLSIVSLILSVVGATAPLGLVFGVVSLKEISRSGGTKRGATFSLWAIFLGGLYVIALTAWLLILFV